MRIAILAWGSLVWDKGHELAEAFDEQHGEWHDDGPVLTIELSRISKKSRPGALTYVIDKDGPACRVKWTLSRRMAGDKAAEDLKKRERTTESNIGFIDRKTNDRRGRDVSSLMTIGNWAGTKKIDVVVWTDLRPNFLEDTKRHLSAEVAIEHVRKLDVEERRRTREYVLRAPIRTRIAEALLAALCAKE